MKNLFLKIGLAVVAAFILIGGGLFVNAQNSNIPAALAQDANVIPYSDQGNGDFGINMNFDGRGLNSNNFQNDLMGRESLLGLIPAFAGLGIIFVVLGLALTIFWVWMLVHAIRHDIYYKPVWILVLWFLNIFGAIIYYFAVKRNCPCCQKREGICVCGNDGNCKCGTIKSEDIEKIKEKIEE